MASTLFTDTVTLVQSSWLNDVDTASYSTLTTVAGTNTITAAGPTSCTAYSNKQIFRFIPAATNTGATTLNVSSIGAKNVFMNGAACVGGEIVINVPCIVIYDGTQFNIANASPATQAQQEAGTSVGVYVTPGRQQYHPSAAKAWGIADFSGSLAASYGLSSVTDTGTGQQTFNFSAPFSSVNYAALCSAELTPGGSAATTAYSIPGTGADKTTSTHLVRTIAFNTFSVADGTKTTYAAYGDLP